VTDGVQNDTRIAGTSERMADESRGSRRFQDECGQRRIIGGGRRFNTVVGLYTYIDITRNGNNAGVSMTSRDARRTRPRG